MPAISNTSDLLPLLGRVATADDPIAALESAGHTFSPELKTRLRPHRGDATDTRRRWARDAAKAGRFTFSSGPQPTLVARTLGAGEFEFSAGVRMSIANEVLAGLHANRTWPEIIFLDEMLPTGTLDLLAGAFVVDRPGGRIGRLEFTAPPTITPVRDGLDRVALTIPFRLNFERISEVMFRKVRTVVTFASGRLRLVVGLTTRVVPVSVAARNLEIQVDLTQSQEARLDLDADSPVQRVNPPNPGEVDGLAVILQNALQQQLADTLRVTISAAIPLPLGKLEIRETALVTRGDAVLVGIKVQGTPGAGNPDTLVPLFPDANANFYTRVHDQVIRLIVQAAARSGQLTQLAKATHPDAVIDSADVVFGTNTISVQAKGKIVDLCPLGVDLGFTSTTTLTTTLEGTRIRVDKSTDQNLDNTDAILCAVTSLGLALLAAVAVIVSQGLGLASGFAAGAAFGVVGVLTLMLEFDDEDFDLVFSSGGDGGPTFIDLDFPFPGTDLLPTLTGAFVRLDESTMLVGGRLGTRPDSINTYFYVRFMEADGVGLARAMRGVRVRLMDRDSPQPAGDDVTLPNPTTVTTAHQTPAGTFSVTTHTRYERSADEQFREATTDHAGRVRIYIPHDALGSRAATKVIETTRLNLDTDVVGTTTKREAVREGRPDFYFRVTRADGTSLDTLELPAGFFLNFQSARIGTAANPLTISFGGTVVGGGANGGLVVFDPM